MTDFRFDAERHEYWLGPVRLPSVTQVLADLYEFDGIPPSILREAAARGTYVHKATELHDRDDLDWTSLHPPYVPYVEAWLRFRDERKPEILEVEQRDYHRRLMYAGTWDRLLMLDGALTLTDVKTTYKVSRVDALQTAGYQGIVEQDRGRKIERRITVQLRKDGSYQVVPWDDRKDFAVFCASLTRHQWRMAA